MLFTFGLIFSNLSSEILSISVNRDSDFGDEKVEFRENRLMILYTRENGREIKEIYVYIINQFFLKYYIYIFKNYGLVGGVFFFFFFLIWLRWGVSEPRLLRES